MTLGLPVKDGIEEPSSHVECLIEVDRRLTNQAAPSAPPFVGLVGCEAEGGRQPMRDRLRATLRLPLQGFDHGSPIDAVYLDRNRGDVGEITRSR